MPALHILSTAVCSAHITVRKDTTIQVESQPRDSDISLFSSFIYGNRGMRVGVRTQHRELRTFIKGVLFVVSYSVWLK